MEGILFYGAMCFAELNGRNPLRKTRHKQTDKTKMKILGSLVTLLMAVAVMGQTKYEKDFEECWNDVNNNYAYLDQQQIDWNKVKEIYQPKVKQISNDNDFIRLMESVLNELHNGHVSLNVNLNTSNRIIPSGQDMFVQKLDGKFIITDLREEAGADLSGLKIGEEIVLFNKKPIPGQVEAFLPTYTTTYSQEMYQYALNMLFAGTHDTERTITVNRNGIQADVFPDRAQPREPAGLVETKALNEKTAYIKINDALGDMGVVAEFDKALDDHMGYKNLVIDLTETPGGGNTTVARCIMGRFVDKPMPYQQHEFDEKDFQTCRKWVEYATPRKTRYKGKVYIVVGRWTGSMGEGIAIGFDGMKRTKVIGTEMAKLLGAVDGFVMTETQIGFQMPTERLYHVDGTPREKYKPAILTRNSEDTMQKVHRIR